jgi:hypothetical protein
VFQGLIGSVWILLSNDGKILTLRGKKERLNMSFRKPFRAVPIKLGEYHLAEQHREKKQGAIRSALTAIFVALVVFVVGMLITNRDIVARYMPRWTSEASPAATAYTYYPNCSVARSLGAAPIFSGSRGYRTELDADRDGIACEPYEGMPSQ